MKKLSLKQVIYKCIQNRLIDDHKQYVPLKEIYQDVADYLEKENDRILQSQIRGRLQENCSQYRSFLGDDLFSTETLKSGRWTINKKYIRYINNKFLVTEDNWKTTREVNYINETYTLELDQDKKYMAWLHAQIGQVKAKIIIEELNHIRELLKDKKNITKTKDGYGTAFEVLAIATIYKLTYEETIDKYIVHGDQDGKIDAIYYNGTQADVYQIKTGNITDNAYHDMQTSYNACFRGKVPTDGHDLFDFIQHNYASLCNVPVNYYSVSVNSEKSTNILPKEIYDDWFKNQLLPLEDNRLSLSVLKPENDNFSCHLGKNFNFFIQAKKLIKYLLEALGLDPNNYDPKTVDLSKYFSDNVRGVLNTNKNMVKTIEEEPENFYKYNNGIRITGTVEDLGYCIKINNPMINNGQQTLMTLIRENKNLDKIILSVNITNESDKIIKGKISNYTNDQKKITAVDLLSLNPFIREIQTFIFNHPKNKISYFLEIYSSGEKSYKHLLDEIYKGKNIIKLIEFLKLYFSVTDNKSLGNWKNSPNRQIQKITIDKSFDKKLSLKVCESIIRFENYLKTLDNKKEKSDLKSADLAFKYLLCKENLSEEEAHMVIKNINQKYYYAVMEDKSKLIDVYKSTTIINKIEEQLSSLKILN